MNRFLRVMRRTLAGLLGAMLIWQASAVADTIAIIGTGNLGSALGPEFAALQHKIIYGVRNPDREDVLELVARTGHGASAATPQEAAAQADIVLLAVPGTVAVDVVRGLGDLSGKILLDATNIFRVDAQGQRTLPLETSNAELIQQAAPGARVVKAFNTMNWRFMVDPNLAGGPISVPISGDDAEAKAKVAELAAGLGLEPIDFGPLSHADVQEKLLLILIHSTQAGRPFNYYLRPVPATQ